MVNFDHFLRLLLLNEQISHGFPSPLRFNLGLHLVLQLLAAATLADEVLD